MLAPQCGFSALRRTLMITLSHVLQTHSAADSGVVLRARWRRHRGALEDSGVIVGRIFNASGCGRRGPQRRHTAGSARIFVEAERCLGLCVRRSAYL